MRSNVAPSPERGLQLRACACRRRSRPAARAAVPAALLRRTLSGIGDAIVPVALTFAVLDLGDATDLGLVLGSSSAARVVFLVAGGVWSDRLPRQLVMMASDVVRAAVQALIAVAFFTDSIQVWQLAVQLAVFGAAGAFFQPASTGLVPRLVSRQRLQEANALLGLARSGIEVFGPVVSGLVVATLGFGIVFAVDAASFVASFLCLAAMRLPRTVERGKQEEHSHRGDGRTAGWSAAALDRGRPCLRPRLQPRLRRVLRARPCRLRAALRQGARDWGSR